MLFLSKILILAAPITVNNVETVGKNTFAPVYVPSEQLPYLNPKNECNFDVSSNIATKKIEHFTYDCNHSPNSWLLINLSEANYYDVLLK